MKPTELKYQMDNMLPALSEQEVTNHYTVHTAQYFDKIAELSKGTAFEGKTLDELVSTKYLNQTNSTLFHAVSQAWNHNFYWQSVCPIDEVGEPSDELGMAIRHAFDGVDDMTKQIVEKGASFFGSGWIWLTFFQNKLRISTTPNGSIPLEGTPLWCCDLWEHAYLYDERYIGDRKAYLTNIVKQINWKFVSEQYGNV